MSLTLYECSGLLVASEIPLSAPLSAATDSRSPDIFVALGDEIEQPFERPSTDVVAELVVEGSVSYTFCRVGGGYLVRFPRVADVAIDGDLARVICHPAIAGRSDVLPIVIPGSVTAFLLSMRGQTVLHGSAVDVGGRALGFVGKSGQGKSTMAAVFCSVGATLITDDVLPLDFGRSEGGVDVISCIRSGREIRLRPKAVSLADRFAEDSVRITEDARHAVLPMASPLEQIPLTVIILPRPDREHEEVSARKLGAGEAAFALSKYERIEGWRDREHMMRRFEDLARVVEVVPVFEVAIPWGPPFAEDLAHGVLVACGLE
jgi:hypothetical protein